MATIKFHIGKSGKPVICRASKNPCPLGADSPHFTTREEAEAYLEEMNDLNEMVAGKEAATITRLLGVLPSSVLVEDFPNGDANHNPGDWTIHSTDFDGANSVLTIKRERGKILVRAEAPNTEYLKNRADARYAGRLMVEHLSKAIENVDHIDKLDILTAEATPSYVEPSSMLKTSFTMAPNGTVFHNATFYDKRDYPDGPKQKDNYYIPAESVRSAHEMYEMPFEWSRSTFETEDETHAEKVLKGHIDTPAVSYDEGFRRWAIETRLFDRIREKVSDGKPESIKADFLWMMDNGHEFGFWPEDQEALGFEPL